MNMTKTSAVGLLLMVAGLTSPHVHADNWIGGTGNWDIDANWSPFLPDEFSYVTINNGGTVQVDSTPLVPYEINIASTNGSTGHLQVLPGGNSGADSIIIGQAGTATATVTDGNLFAGGQSLFVGSNTQTSGQGTLTVNDGGAVISGDDFQLGRNGTGTATFSTGSYGTGIYTVVGKFGSGEWNHLGGVYAQADGDIEIGDGGKPDQWSTPGSRTGTINLSGGAFHVAGAVAIGNRIGSGTVSISGGGLAITGDPDARIGDARANSLFIGRGMNWTPGDVSAHGVTGNDTTLRVVGDQSVIAVGLDLVMDPNDVFASSTLVAEITGATHTPILVGRNADIANGTFAVEFNGYAPTAGDQWSIIQTNVDLSSAMTAFDALVTAENLAAYYDTGGNAIPVGDAITHNNNAVTENGTDPSFQGVIGPFAATDFSAATLPAGLEFDLEYLTNEVLLKVVSTGTPGDFNGDLVVDGHDLLAWQRGQSPQGVTGGDLTLWQDNFGAGTSTPVAGSVPEPATCGLLALAAFVTAVRRRRR